MSMAGPSFHMFEHQLGCLPRRDGPVINHRRGDAARADAAGGEQRDFTVGRGLARLDLGLILDRGSSLSAPLT